MKKIKKWKKEFPRILAATLAVVMLFNMPGTALYAGAETVEMEEKHSMEDTSETDTEQTADKVTEEPEAETSAVRESDVDDSDPDELETGDEDTEKTETGEEERAEEKPARVPGEETKECTCDDLCTENSINEDCPVCSAEDADLSCCKGVEEDTAEDGQEDTETEESSIRIIEKLIAALPDQVTEDNAKEVRAQLDKILALYRELTEEEQEQVDISRCLELQEVSDAANAPASMEEPAEGAVAKVEKEGEVPTYLISLADAFTSVQAGGTIILLNDVELTEKILINSEYSGNITLDLNGYRINSSIWLGGDVNLTICGSGNIQTSKGSAVHLSDGTLTLEGGSFSSSDSSNNGCGIDVEGGTLNVTSDSVTIDRLYVGSGTVSLTAGTYTGSPAIETGSNSLTLGSLLGDNCAYYKDNQPLVLAELTETMDGPITVRVCKHPDVLSDNGDGTHGGDCPYCGAELDAEPHIDTDGDGKCDECKEQLAVKVEIGGTAAYYTTIETAWKAADGNTATVTLLANVETSDQLNVMNSANITFEGGGFTLTGTDSSYAISVSSGTLTVQSGTIAGTGNKVVTVSGGTLEVTGGEIRGGEDMGIQAVRGTVRISGGTIFSNGYGLQRTENADIKISGGTFQSIYLSSGGDVSDILLNYGDTDAEKHYAFYNKDGLPVSADEIKLGKGPYTVKECHHEGVEFKPDEGATTHTFYCGACGYTETGDCSYSFDENIGTCSLCSSKIKVIVTGTEGLVYKGSAHEPGVTVTLNSADLEEEKYSVSYENNTDAGTAFVVVSGKDGAAWSYQQEFTINKADVTADDLEYAPPADLVYTGAPKTASMTAKDNHLPNIGEITLEYKKDNTDHFIKEAIEPGTYHVYAVISNEKNYNDAKIEMDSFTISYMVSPTVLYNGSSTQKEYYNGDVAVSGESLDGHTYTVSDAIDANYSPSFTISAPEGTESTVTKTLYFKDEAGHISAGVDVTVKFDRAAPTGKIAVGARWWQELLSVITFKHYAAKEYTVTIEAEDTGGSKIDKIEYVIVKGASQYTDAGTLAAANLSWADYNKSSRPTVPVSMSQYVVYARLTDGAGNVTYISTDGILLDNTPPVVSDLNVPDDETRKDVSAGFTFKVSEAGNYYYVVLPKGSDAPSAEDIIVTCGGTLPDGKTGKHIDGVVSYGDGAAASDALTVSAEARKLQANTAYTLYVTAVDNAVDITSSEAGTPAGNIGNVASADFTTKKTLPVISKTPTVTGTYGQSLGEMTIAGGTAKDGDTVLTGTWAVNSADSSKKPSAGTTEEITVIFTPDNDSYDSIQVKVTLTVNARSLEAEGVAISEVAGTYNYTGSKIEPPVAVNTGNPSAGIYLSDSGAELTADDFTVSYSDNQNVGTATVTITGKGNYTGFVERKFPIGKAPGRTMPDLTESYTDDGFTYTYTATQADGALYRMGEDGGWQEGNVFAGITPGTTIVFFAKMPGTENYEEGETKSIEVVFPKLTPPAPEFTLLFEANGETDYTVTIPPTEGCEYSFDGENWSDHNRKTGVQVGETVTGYKRYKETDAYHTGNIASDTKQMPKFTVKTPAVTPGSGSYTGSVSVTITCGSADAEIYYTTDGSTPDGSSTRYTGAFTVTPTVTVKAIAIKEGLTDSAVVEVTYTKKSSSGSGGSGSSGGGNNGDSGSSSNHGDNNNGNGGGGETSPATPNPQPADPDKGTNPAAPGTGDAIKPGTGTVKPGNGTAQDNTQQGREPFIKGADGKIGWDVIRAEEEKAQDGNIINVDMNGSVVVPGDIFDSIKGRDITITFDMGNGILWSVDGKSITRDASRDKADDIDFSVRTGVSAIPVDIVNNVTGESYSIQISLAYSGEFGFTAVLSINLGEENAGYTASLYYYKESTGELTYICSDIVAEDGTVSLAFTHASDYVIAIDYTAGEEGSDAAQAEGEGSGQFRSGADGSGETVRESPKEVQGRGRNPAGLILAGLIVLAGIGAGIFIVLKKKKE